MNLLKLSTIFALTMYFSMTSVAKCADTLNLAGLWHFQLDPMGFGMTPGSELFLGHLSESIILPGSTDTGSKGVRNSASHIDRLSRKYEYLGMAWYQREVTIPNSWQGKDITLELERCHWITTLYIDNKEIGKGERLSTPNRWDVTAHLNPGVHVITLCIDNRSPYPMDQWSHGLTEYTQTNWNGIVGGMHLTARPTSHIERIDIYPDLTNNSVKIVTKAKVNSTSNLKLVIANPNGKILSRHCNKTAVGDSIFTNIVCLGKNVHLWDEFNPDIYTVTATLDNGIDSDSHSERFGMRSVTQGKHHIQVNGISRHLRGTLDCAVWPLTGYPSTNKSDWLRQLSTIKDYGMNHVRFHSWCPPKAAFEAADELGIYLQVELPMWLKDIGKYADRRDWFEREMYALLNEYGNHPSFLLFCNGNENEGDFAVLNDLITKGKAYDSRHLYSASTARTHTNADQYYVSHVTDKGWITVYEGQPATNWTVNTGCDIDVPVIAHESGQRCMYPDFKEMSKYTGILEPRNMSVFRDRLASMGMLHQAEDFFQATGAHTVLQYKAVNEALLGSDKSGGFQLLGLQDYPGQGCAYVGILDAFWESKGLVTPEEFRESCAPQVILAGLPKRIYSPSEQLSFSVRIYNFGPSSLPGGAMKWHLDNENGTVIASGKLACRTIGCSTIDSIGMITTPLTDVTTPSRLTLHIEKADLHNSWNIWVYPENDDLTASTFVTDIEEALRRAADGESVLLVPRAVQGRHTQFASHFWTPIMFKWDPMIVGTLINNHHPAFNSFPTDMYTDWQWTDILNNAHTLDLTDIPDITPVIQSIDTYEVNRKLGIAFEANIGEGKLFVLCLDPENNIANRPASRRLLNSVSDYVNGDNFNPKATLEPWQIKSIFAPSANKKHTKDTSEAVNQLLNQ